MDMPEKIWANNGENTQTWLIGPNRDHRTQYIHIDAVHRLVKRALEEAASQALWSAGRWEDDEGNDAGTLISEVIRSLSPEEIMKKDGL